MGGLLSGIDQSLISGANLFLPACELSVDVSWTRLTSTALNLTTKQVSLVSSGVPLGAVGGALVLGPLNEAVGRRMAIIVSLCLYTIGAALEAGAISFGMMVAGRVILGLGVGLEGGTVPVYVAESVSRKYRGNLVSLYQFMIALGEVFGYVVAAIFVNVKSGSWRYMLGSSLVFSTIMFGGIIFMPESPRYLMHKGKTTEAWFVWKRIRGEDEESRKEFFVMRHSVQEESLLKDESGGSRRFVWIDFFTVPRARRAIIYANSTFPFFCASLRSLNLPPSFSPLKATTSTRITEYTTNIYDFSNGFPGPVHWNKCHPVLYGNSDVSSWIQLQRLRLHVPRGRWKSPSRNHPSHSVHGEIRTSILGVRHAARLLHRSRHHWMQLPHRLED